MIEYILGILILILLVIYFLALKKITKLILLNEELAHNYRSMSVRHGQSWEQFLPFTKEFENIAHRENFTFIGMPVDGIAFEENAVKFIEVKTGKSKLSEKQKRIKELIENKKVEWHELRF